jgi:single-strand DNA-binding protein
MNKWVGIGRLTKAPEQKQTSNGIAVCTFSIAVNRRMNREQTDYINVVAWRGLAETCGKYLSKGQQVAVIGELQTRTYDDKNGTKRYVTEVIAEEVEFLAKSNGSAQTGAQSAEPQEAHEMTSAEYFAQMTGIETLENEELPF